MMLIAYIDSCEVQERGDCKATVVGLDAAWLLSTFLPSMHDNSLYTMLL